VEILYTSVDDEIVFLCDSWCWWNILVVWCV